MSDDTTTDTEESAMAPPATMGGNITLMSGKKRPAAMGIPRVLYLGESAKRGRGGEGEGARE